MGNLSFQDKLRHFIESHFDLLRKNPKMPTLILNELSRRPDQINVLREKLHTLPEQLFAELEKELQVEIKKGNIRDISMMDIIISMLSLNIALFVIMPIAEKMLQINEIQKEYMITHRRAENVEFILKSLRP
jgi:TetR/AcrR family transcriptional regulator